MTEPKIAFVIHGLSIGGAERFFISLVNNLHAAGQPLEVVLLSDNNPLLGDLAPGITVNVFKRKSKYDLSVGSRIKKYLSEQNMFKVFAINTFPFFIVKLAYLFDRKTKFYLSLHSTKPRTKKEFLLNLGYFRMLNKMDTLLFISRLQGEYLSKKYFIRSAASKVVYNGIGTHFFSIPARRGEEEKRKLKLDYSLPPAGQVILSTGRLSPEKAHFTAVESLKILHDQYNRKAHLVYVGAGDPSYTEPLVKFINEKGLEQFVHFAGQHRDVRPFFFLADIFTLTSYSETFSLAALEAMSSGLPCSLTEVGGAAEMITPETGLLSISGNPASIAHTWSELLQKQFDPRILHDYVESNFSLEKMVDGYRAVLA